MTYFDYRNRLGPTGTLMGGGVGVGGQALTYMRNTFGTGGPNQIEHLSLPSVAGATFSKTSAGHGISSHLLGQENHSENIKGQGI